MARRRPIPKRKRIFVAAEGEGDRALARWFQELCDERGLNLHLHIVVAGGGDTRRVVEYAVDQRRRHNETRVRDRGALVLLDADRLLNDRAAGRDPETVPGRGDLRLVYLTPNLEGLLFRLHPGREARFVAPQDAERRLQELWPDYRKPASAASLRRRFNLNDLLRAASCDLDLHAALTFLGLLSEG